MAPLTFLEFTLLSSGPYKHLCSSSQAAVPPLPHILHLAGRKVSGLGHLVPVPPNQRWLPKGGRLKGVPETSEPLKGKDN